ncbi:MAG: primosomal protein N' [Rhodospirillaceae bacterium]|jgi:primosomal protein N' (replication factor Y) (superfamily II helicase)|nr:primosomal protein N' [Rhodospirillaceae bacterium]MBT6118883.1 primosomal protein N' [Rhodospirillaceae bacterium]
MPAPHASSPPASKRDSESDSAAGQRLRVLLPLPLAGAYDYRAPPGMALVPGTFVRVPLGRREIAGVVWDRMEDKEGGSGEIDAARLRDVSEVLDAPPMSDALRGLIDWIAAYTLAPPGAVLRMAMNVPAALEPPRPITAYRRAAVDPEASDVRLTLTRRRVLALLADSPARPAGEIAREAGTGASVVKGMAEAGLLEAVSLKPRADFARPDPERVGPILSPDQRAAGGALRDWVAAGCYGAILLDGVPGAGKTEVYFEAIAEALRRGRQALVLVPEIALTAQWLERFERRFGVMPAVWHSDLTQARRRETWRAVAEGEAAVVVAARSGLFLPFPDLGAIIVDEEHDPSFKQEEGVIYHARDMAVVRAHLSAIPIVLVSATPSLESVANVEAGRYDRLHLPARHGGAALPAISAVDMRADPPPRQSWLSPTLRTALEETFAAGEQAMLFLNRRGYAPLTLCRACGHRLQCPHCTAWLVEHRLTGRLMCHHCGHDVAFPRECPSCGAEDSLAACGPGVERLAEEVAGLWPDLRTAVMASDTVGGPEAAQELVRAVRDHEIDLLIGTQIVAKGHHFPMLTLVGVVDADLGLAGGDLRAAERTYQLLYQVAGRAGREARPGRVLLQTYMPEHPVLAALVSGDRDGFVAAEAEARRDHGMPPFGRLAALIVSGPRADEVDQVARALGRRAPRGSGVLVLGPAPAPLALLRGRHRRRLLLKAPRGRAVQPLLRGWVAAVKTPASVRVQVDVDPYSFL